MILIVVLVAALVVGLLRGGRLHQLANIELRYGALAVGALLIQSGVIYVPWLAAPSQQPLAVGLMIVSNLLLLTFVWLNNSIPGIKLAGAGLLLNAVVIAVNGGFMPVSPETLQRMGFAQAPLLEPGMRVPGSKDVVLATEATRLWFLSDIFITPRQLPWVFAFSAGDILLSSGIFWLVLSAMQPLGCMPQSNISRPDASSQPHP